MAKQLAAVHNVVFMYLSPIRDVRIPLKLLMPNLEVKRAIGERFTYLDSILNVLLAGVITYILFPNILVSFVIRISLLGPATVEAIANSWLAVVKPEVEGLRAILIEE